MSLYLPRYLNLSSRTCTWDGGIKGRISWARDELSEDESPSFGQQSQSRSGGCNGWSLCLSLSWLPCTLINWKLSWYLMSQCHYSYDCAESRQSDLEVKVNNFHVNQVEALIILAFYQSSCTVTRDLLKIDDLNQWRLRKLLGIKWYHHVRNNEQLYSPLAEVKIQYNTIQ